MKMTRSILLASATALLCAGALHAQIEYEILGTDAGASLGPGGHYNTLLGDYSGFLLTNGQSNTYIGNRAEGGYTYLEWQDWVNNGTPLPDIGGTSSTGGKNVFVGAESGLRNLTGLNNTFVGAQAGYANSSGSDNTFIGNDAGKNTTTGVDNVFVGEQAGWENTTGSDNVFVGKDAGWLNVDGDENTGIGNEALNKNTSGWGNTGLGHQAAIDNTTGIKNTSVGWAAGLDNSDGILNTMIGVGAGNASEYADFNTFVGSYAGTDNNRTNDQDNANRNTAIGVLAGGTNRTGEDNVMIGAFADSSDYFSADQNQLLSDLTTTSEGSNPSGQGDTEVFRIVNIGSYGYTKGNDAVGLGYKNRSHGTGGIALGSQATSNHTQAIAIGYQATSHGNNIAVIGNESTDSIDPGVDDVVTLGSSDYRYESVHAAAFEVLANAGAPARISFIADAGGDNNDHWRLQAADSGDFAIASNASGNFAEVLSLDHSGNTTVTGDLVSNSDARLKTCVKGIDSALSLLEPLQGHTYEWKQETGRNPGTQYGLIAQEVEAILPELVHEDGKGGIKSVNYQGFVPLLIDTMDELEQQNQLQQEEIEILRKQLEVQQELLKHLNTRT